MIKKKADPTIHHTTEHKRITPPWTQQGLCKDFSKSAMHTNGPYNRVALEDRSPHMRRRIANWRRSKRDEEVGSGSGGGLIKEVRRTTVACMECSVSNHMRLIIKHNNAVEEKLMLVNRPVRASENKKAERLNSQGIWNILRGKGPLPRPNCRRPISLSTNPEEPRQPMPRLNPHRSHHHRHQQCLAPAHHQHHQPKGQSRR